MDNNIISKKSTAVAETSGKKTMQQYVQIMSGEIAKALPSVITPERFTRIVLSALSTNPKLSECTPQSFLGAMMQSAQMGLEVNTVCGHAYLIPYYNRKEKRMECQFQIGYRGMIDLADRNGIVVDAQVVYANDTFDYELGLEPKLIHKPVLINRGEPIAYYATWKKKEGAGSGFAVMSKEDVDKHAQRFSQAFETGPWKTNYDSMAKKTVIKQALKYAPIKSEFVKAVSADETIKTEISEDMYEVPAVIIDTDPDTGEVIEETPADVK